MHLKRRDVLKLGGAAALSAAGLRLPANDPVTPGDGFHWDRVLVLVELKGGNDGLNTVVPYADAEYARLRKGITVGRDQVQRLSPALGLHPRLAPLMAAHEAGELAVVLGCGYRQPNRSHFRGIDIWNSGSDSDQILHTGWLARVLDAQRAAEPGDLVAHAVLWDRSDAVGHSGLGPLEGVDLRTLVMQSPHDFLERTAGLEPIAAEARNPAHARILSSLEATAAARTRLQRIVDDRRQLARFPQGHFGSQLEHTATFIASGARIPVYKLTLDGFDTHADQRWRHEQLLGQLGEGLAALRQACIAAGTWDRVMVMTYSEFGRRALANASGGTDHGTAAPHVVLGGRVKGGLYGEQPSLTDLAYHDLKYTTDFRRLYRSAASEWLGHGGDFLTESGIEGLGLVRG